MTFRSFPAMATFRSVPYVNAGGVIAQRRASRKAARKEALGIFNVQEHPPGTGRVVKEGRL